MNHRADHGLRFDEPVHSCSDHPLSDQAERYPSVAVGDNDGDNARPHSGAARRTQGGQTGQPPTDPAGGDGPLRRAPGIGAVALCLAVDVGGWSCLVHWQLESRRGPVRRRRGTRPAFRGRLLAVQPMIRPEGGVVLPARSERCLLLQLPPSTRTSSIGFCHHLCALRSHMLFAARTIFCVYFMPASLMMNRVAPTSAPVACTCIRRVVFVPRCVSSNRCDIDFVHTSLSLSLTILCPDASTGPSSRRPRAPRTPA